MAVELAFIGEATLPWLNAMFGQYGGTARELCEIMGINILLSGDNAVVIALACRSLPSRKRMAGIVLGVAAAILLRLVFTIGLQVIIHLPWFTVTGGVVLLLLAVQLLVEADEGDQVIADSTTLAGAVWRIAVADVVMSFDNVLAIAGVSHGKPWLVFVGFALSIPLIVCGATLIITILTRIPLLVWAGAAMLGWIGGELIGSEPMLRGPFAAWAEVSFVQPAQVPLVFGAVGAAIVVLAGLLVHATRLVRRA